MTVRRLIAACAFALVTAGAAGAQASAAQPARSPSHVRAAEELLRAADLERVMNRSTESLLKGQIASMPQLAPYEDILRDFYREQLNWETMKGDVMNLYLDTFSERELRDLTAFYRTPLGQKVLTALPEIMTKSMELGQQRAQAAMPKLMERLQARAQELEQKEKPAKPPE